MTVDQASDVVRQALWVGLMISAPILTVGLLVGLVVSIVQAVTQIQEQTLSFIPKIFGMAIVTLALIPWLYVRMLEFASRMFAP